MKQFFVITMLLSFATFGCSQKNGEVAKSKDGKNPLIADYVKGKNYEKYDVATFAGGCFWCTEASFERIEGVVDVISGYSGGDELHPTYQQIGTGMTGHTESIQIYFDPEIVSFDKLLDVFFVAHDPTTLNRQGPDRGPQYRSAIFYHSDEQKKLVDAKIKTLNASTFDNKIVTEVAKYEEFWVAEAYHQDFYELNPRQSYVYNVSRPKVEKVEKTFKDILKKEYKK